MPIEAQEDVANMKLGVWLLYQDAIILINQSHFSILKDDDDPF